ncbi:MAG: penicillin-binding protein 2 [Candidatus Daviesbacteria bacterium]|nr:penicillin-binding protein 2 [Candidatus Daviesbacteria bacterium]
MSRSKKTLGFGFADELARVTGNNKHFQKVTTSSWQDSLVPNFDPNVRVDLERSFWRVTLFLCFTVIIFFALFVRLFHLTIANGKVNRNLADGNRVQIRLIHAPRGVIYDRNGKILATNSPGFRLVDPVTKKATFLTREESFALEVRNDPQAVNLEIDSIRKYPYAEASAHVLGYVGEISENQLKDPEFKNYRLGDRIGQSGIESYYESFLRGTDGGEIIEVDSKGNKLRTLRTVAPTSGQNVYLTIDIELQQQVYKNLSDAVKKSGSCCGAVVASSPQTGEILAMVSVPSYDNNLFTNYEQNEQVSEILNDPNSPILNRTISGTYPPGSTFKIVSSIAALGSGKVDPKMQINDTGEMYLGTFKFTNWYFTQYGRTEGLVDLVKAMQRSNDIYFYQIGQILGEKILGDYAKKLRMGSQLGIDLSGESKGLIPDDLWKQKNFNQVWYPGDTLHMAIGQGFVLATPLQILGITAYVAADGNLYKPHLFLKATADDGTTIKKSQPENLVSKIITKDQLEVVKTGLKQVPLNGGTAWPFFTFPIPTAGKTGTAEFGDPKDEQSSIGRYSTHAWYTSYAPAIDPKIALTVLVEAGGEGSSVSAPVAKEIYRWYFSPDKNNLIKDTNQVASDSARILGE